MAAHKEVDVNSLVVALIQAEYDELDDALDWKAPEATPGYFDYQRA